MELRLENELGRNESRTSDVFETKTHAEVCTHVRQTAYCTSSANTKVMSVRVISSCACSRVGMLKPVMRVDTYKVKDLAQEVCGSC